MVDGLVIYHRRRADSGYAGGTHTNLAGEWRDVDGVDNRPYLAGCCRRNLLFRAVIDGSGLLLAYGR